MPTCRDIITRALRKVRVYAAGEEPTADDMADGMDELQNLYEQWGSNGMFGRLTDVTSDSDYEAASNERITLYDGGTVTIPTTVEIDGETYPPYDTAFVEVIDTDASTVDRYIYERGAWVLISDLSLDDEAPLASKGRGGLAACLALSLAEEFGAEVGGAVMRQAGAFKTGLSLKYGGDANRSPSEYF